MSRSRKRLLYGLAGVVVLVVAVAVGWRLFSGNAPDAVALDDAVRAVQSTTTTTASGTPSTTTPASGGETTTTTSTATPSEVGVDGTWTVNREIGEFSFQDATSSFVGFRVDEELRGVGSVEAVGRTPDVSGTVEIEGTTMTAATFTAALATLTTDRSQRDGAVRRALDTVNFPDATFTVAEPVDFGAIPGGGESISVTTSGELTVKGVTQPVEFELEAQLVDDIIVVVGRIPLVFADFGVTVPSAPAVLSAADNGVVEFQLFLTR